MAVYFGEKAPDGVTSYLVHRSHIVPVCSPRMLDDHEAISSMHDLISWPLIHVSSRKDEWPKMMQQAGVSMTGLEKGLSFSSTQLALGAALEGLGVALSDRGLVARETTVRSTDYPSGYGTDHRQGLLSDFTRMTCKLTYGMRVFRDWLLEVMGLANPTGE